MPEAGISGVFKAPNLPVIPDDLQPSLQLYLQQLNDQLLNHITPTMWMSDRLYEIDQICGHRDVTYDFNVGDLNTNGDWHYLDLSSIIGKHETLVKLQVYLVDDATGSTLNLRRYGSTYTEAQCITQAANIGIGFIVDVKSNSDGIIEYQATNTTWTTLSIRVLSWRPVYVIGG